MMSFTAMLSKIIKETAMNKTSLLSLIIATATIMGTLVGCAHGDNHSGSSETTDGTEEKTMPKLMSLTVEGEEISFSPDINEYTVKLPDGHPAIPKIEATAEDGAQITVIQGTVAVGEDEGSAEITVSSQDGENRYTVRFVKDSEKGFYLQYADVYDYKPDYIPAEGEKITYKSSDESAVTVSDKGKVTAVAVTDIPVTVTAYVGEKEIGTLKIDKIEKAPINIFLVIGQSNAFGWHDTPSGVNQQKYFRDESKKFDKPICGTVWADDVTTSYDDYKFSGMYDLGEAKGCSGFYPALGKEWYALTGEKSLMLKTAVGSTPIEAWTADPELRFFGIDLYGMTVERFNYYRELFSAEESGFVINRVCAFWLQGETCEEYVYDPSEHTWDSKNGQKNYKYKGDWKTPSSKDELMTAAQYTEYFMSMYSSLVKDIGLEFIGILPVRSMTSVSSEGNLKEQQLVDLVAPRVSQFAMNYSGKGNIAIVTLVTDIARTESYSDKNAEGWGYIGCYNIHYNQIGYNAIGKDSALNAARLLTAYEDKTAEQIRVYDTNGRDIIENGASIRMECGSTKQITAIVLPLYAEMRTLTFTPSDPEAVKIDANGLITVPYSDDSIGKEVSVEISNGDIKTTVTIKIT